MAVASRRGELGEPPPRKITRKMLQRVAPRVARSPKKQRAATVVAHFAFGAVTGAVYALLHPGSPTLASGIRFGSFVWAASYAGWVPAMGIMPMPQNDMPGRPRAMVGAHWAFGAVLALTLRALRVRSRG